MTGEAIHKKTIGRIYSELTRREQRTARAKYPQASSSDGWRYVFNQWGELIGRCWGF